VSGESSPKPALQAFFETAWGRALRAAYTAAAAVVGALAVVSGYQHGAVVRTGIGVLLSVHALSMTIGHVRRLTGIQVDESPSPTAQPVATFDTRAQADDAARRLRARHIACLVVHGSPWVAGRHGEASRFSVVVGSSRRQRALALLGTMK
jgi:hypothetical protein